MAREDIILGNEVGGYVLPHVINSNVAKTIQSDSGSFDEDRYGGFYIGKQPGESTITLSFQATVDVPDNDALDVLYGEILTELYTRAGTGRGTTPLWMQDDWFYEVGLSNITEDERTEYYVKFAATFIAKKGKIFHRDLVSNTYSNGDSFTISSPMITNPYIEIETVNGVPIGISHNRSGGIVRINPTQTGLMRLYLHENTAVRFPGGIETDALDEIAFAWPRWPSNVTITVTLAGALQFDLHYRKAMM